MATARRSAVGPDGHTRRSRLVGLLLLGGLTVGGTRQAAAQPAAPEPGAPTLELRLCAGRLPCRQLSLAAAGASPAGENLQVVQLALHEGPGPARDAAPQPCLSVEYWLVRNGAPTRSEPQLLLRACGPGSSEQVDEVRVGPNRLTHVRVTPGAWRWRSERSLQLVPLQGLDETRQGASADGSGSYQASWSWERFAGEVSWQGARCGAPDGNPTGPPVHFGYLPVPRVDLADTLQSDWVTTRLGSCAAQLDSSGRHGYILAGTPGEADDARLALLQLSSRLLLVEIRDDHWRLSGRTLGGDDHLQLWLGPGVDPERCIGEAAAPTGWLIRLSDGRVTPAASPTPTAGRPAVERQEVVLRGGGTMLRLRLRFPTDVEALTVAYSDSDDGRGPERVLASSLLQPGLAASLGQVLVIDPRRAVCEVRRDALQPQPLPPAPTEAALSAER